MNATRCVPVLFAASSLLAQQSPETPNAALAAPFAKTAPAAIPLGAPADSVRQGHDATAVGAAQHAAALQRLGLVFDDVAGTSYAASDGWKAAFDGEGATFVPFLGSEAERNLPTRFRLRAVNGQRVGVGTVARSGDLVRIERPAVSERYRVDERGIEQSFVFDTLPTREALRVTLDVDGEFAVMPHDGGFRFTHALGAFTYGRAVAIDATGARVDVAAAWTGSGLTLEVPAAFVAAARLPLVIDPLIGNPTTVAQSTTTVRSVDVAYDASLDQFVVCWERVFSATDSDVYVRRLDGAMQPIAATLPLDVSTTSWTKCKVAGLNAYDLFLVVAECQAAPALPYIGGRLVPSSGALPPFVVQQGTLPCHAPVVGGDPSLVTPTYFTVAWEQDYTATDRDVFYVQVRSDGTLRSNFVALDASGAFEHSPVISKSDGQGSAASQGWALAWRRNDPTGTMGATRAALLSWDGQLQPMGPSGLSVTLNGFAAPATAGGLAVSSPTDVSQGRAFLVADTVVDSQTGHPYLRGTVIDRAGAVLATGQQLSFPTDADFDPALDCDGARFVMTWRESWNPDRLVHAVYDLVPGGVVRPVGDYVTLSLAGERTGGVVAKHSGGAALNHEREYAIAWSENGTNTVFTQGYLGMGTGGFTTRATGCGPLTVSAFGVPAIGETIAVTLGGTVGLAGWAFGDPIDVPLFECPGCRVGTTAYVLTTGSTFPLAIPWNPLLVNVQFALQGFDLAAGSCFGSIALSDTIDLRVQ